LTLRRANMAPKPVPEQSEVLFFCLIALAMLIYGGLPLQMWNMIPGLVLTELIIFLFLPLAFALYLKLDLRKTFRLRSPSPKSIFLTLLLFAGIQLSIGTIQYLQNLFLPMPQELGAYMEKLMKAENGKSFFAVFAVIALLPAICEEAMFRGLV